METTRSLSSRNFWGGLLGGLLGLAAFVKIHAAAIPVGCLLGVVVGFWYQEISAVIVTALVTPAIEKTRHRKWSELHPMEKALVADVLSVTSFFIIMFTLVIYPMVYFNENIAPTSSRLHTVLFFSTLVTVPFLLLVSVFSVVAAFDGARLDGGTHQRHFYRRFEAYAKHGPVGGFV